MSCLGKIFSSCFNFTISLSKICSARFLIGWSSMPHTITYQNTQLEAFNTTQIWVWLVASALTAAADCQVASELLFWGVTAAGAEYPISSRTLDGKYRIWLPQFLRVTFCFFLFGSRADSGVMSSSLHLFASSPFRYSLHSAITPFQVSLFPSISAKISCFVFV